MTEPRLEVYPKRAADRQVYVTMFYHYTGHIPVLQWGISHILPGFAQFSCASRPPGQKKRPAPWAGPPRGRRSLPRHHRNKHQAPSCPTRSWGLTSGSDFPMDCYLFSSGCFGVPPEMFAFRFFKPLRLFGSPVLRKTLL